ncbi:MAG: hypothetical protein R6V49_05125 [Bacteroidales bacterium]
MMHWYQWIALGTFGLCLGICSFHLIRLIRLGKPDDKASPSGSIPKGVAYSFTAGMSPKKKESAFLHLPTYLAGILYHLGIFGTIALFILLMFVRPVSANLIWQTIALLLSVSCVSGAAILIKRIGSAALRRLSNPDDYISNLLVTLFQGTAILYLLLPPAAPVFFLTAALLWLYFPLGKLKHAIYFFAARYHLGVFFGSRGVWPATKNAA